MKTNFHIQTKDKEADCNQLPRLNTLPLVRKEVQYE